MSVTSITPDSEPSCPVPFDRIRVDAYERIGPADSHRAGNEHLGAVWVGRDGRVWVMVAHDGVAVVLEHHGEQMPFPTTFYSGGADHPVKEAFVRLGFAGDPLGSGIATWPLGHWDGCPAGPADDDVEPRDVVVERVRAAVEAGGCAAAADATRLIAEWRADWHAGRPVGAAA